MECGILGLPNVGKSTLFNALTKSSNAMAANYPFCTIDPNSASVKIYDQRLEILAKIASSAKVIPSIIQFTDIAGLVKGASKGEGLGNKFLGNIAGVNALVHVVRCFESSDVIHVNGKVDPKNDIEIINTELIISDLEKVEKTIHSIEKRARTSKDKVLMDDLKILEECKQILESEKFVKTVFNEILDPSMRRFNLITSKPVIYVANVSESDIQNHKATNKHASMVKEIAEKEGCPFHIISAKVEEELVSMDEIESLEYLKILGIPASGLSLIAATCKNILNLKTYFTIGPKESRSWLFRDGITAPDAAEIIHTDFKKGFIRAEVISYEDYIENNGELGAKNKGKMRLEGKNYIVQDGDVVHFRFNV